jgi:hypothetical protein
MLLEQVLVISADNGRDFVAGSIKGGEESKGCRRRRREVVDETK